MTIAVRGRRPRLSHLVGPGPGARSSTSPIRIGLVNTDVELHVTRLRVSLVNPQGESVAHLQVSLLLPKRSSHRLDALLDWTGGSLVLDGQSGSFPTPSDVRAIYIVRAELLTLDELVYDVLEIGVASSFPVSEGEAST